MIEILQNTDNLSLKEAMITELDIAKTEQIGLNSKKIVKKRIKGVKTFFGSYYSAKSFGATKKTSTSSTSRISSKF